MRATRNRIKAISKEIDKQAPEDKIFICWRHDGYVDYPMPDGSIKVITEAEYLANGGKIVQFGDPPIVITKDRPRVPSRLDLVNSDLHKQ